MSFSFPVKFGVLFFACAAAIAGITVSSFRSSTNVGRALDMVRNTAIVREQAATQLLALFREISNGFEVAAMTGERSLLEHSDRSRSEFTELLDKFEKVSDGSRAKSVTLVRSAFEQYYPASKNLTVRLIESDDENEFQVVSTEELNTLSNRAATAHNELSAMLDQLVADAHRQTVSITRAASDGVQRQARTTLLIGLLLLLGLAIALLGAARKNAALEARVSERTRQLEDSNTALERRAAELARSNQELDDFAYIASHDLKEPLRGIHNYATFLLEDYGDKLEDDGRAKLETLPRLTQRMETLIDSLLQFSRIGRVDLAVTETDLNAVLEDLLDSVHITLEERNVDVVIPRPLPTVTCDRVRVGEVFRNLITNAIKYNDKPDKTIEIGCDPGAPGDVFYVRDNGIGIPEKHLDSVFDIFKRLHGRDKFGGGTGAGLTITKKIVERHGGELRVESTLGEGSTFYFTLEGGMDGNEHDDREAHTSHLTG